MTLSSWASGGKETDVDCVTTNFSHTDTITIGDVQRKIPLLKVLNISFPVLL